MLFSLFKKNKQTAKPNPSHFQLFPSCTINTVQFLHTQQLTHKPDLLDCICLGLHVTARHQGLVTHLSHSIIPNILKILCKQDLNTINSPLSYVTGE